VRILTTKENEQLLRKISALEMENKALKERIKALEGEDKAEYVKCYEGSGFCSACAYGCEYAPYPAIPNYTEYRCVKYAKCKEFVRKVDE
jgi:hypothetical protein